MHHKQQAAVWLSGASGEVLVYPLSRFQSGQNVLAAPPLVLISMDTAREVIGSMVREAVAASGQVAWPMRDWHEFWKRVVDAPSRRSFRRLALSKLWPSTFGPKARAWRT